MASGALHVSPSPLKFLKHNAKSLGIGVLVLTIALLWSVPSIITNAGRQDFLPHSFCYLQTRSLIRLHLTSDLAIGISYVAISFTLAYLVFRARRHIPFSWMLLVFGVFIVACGGTHFMEVVTLW